MTTPTPQYCRCPTDRRPRADADGKCPKCGLLRPIKVARAKRPSRAKRIIIREIDPLDQGDNLGASPD